ncbi:MAG: hypothetical protein V4734_04040 [Terriglobus sp.]
MSMRNDLEQIVENAEREVGNFYEAVLEKYGSAEARLALLDWLDIMDNLESLPDKSIRHWHQVTILASYRLAMRVFSSGSV